MSSLDFDLFLLPDDISSEGEYDLCSILNDDSIQDIICSFDQVDQYQLQTSTSDDSKTQSQVTDLECRVCGAPAFGYNFDQITCESCKAFFRRNALRDMSSLKCRFSGSCVIDMNTRRRCAYCRLKKCFDVNMRKDWIRTEEEKVWRQLQKVAKQQNKVRSTSNQHEVFTNMPIVARKKKRLITISSSPAVTEHPVNSNS